MIIILNNDEIFLSKTRGMRFTLLRINPRGHGVKHCKRRFFVVAVAIMQSVKVHSVHPLSFLLGGGGGLSIQPNFQKKREPDRISIFRGTLRGKRGVTFFRGCSFYIKNNLKSE